MAAPPPAAPSQSGMPSRYPEPPASTFQYPPPPMSTMSSYTPMTAPAPMQIIPPGPTNAPSIERLTGPAMASRPMDRAHKKSFKDAKSTAEFALREYMALQRRRASEGAVEELVRTQAGAVLSDLRILRKNVADVVKAAENHRWRRWVLGGVLASFIPALRSIFSRPKEDKQAANNTEYAFLRTNSLLRRIIDSVRGKGVFASFAFFIFAVLYVFQNEVSLRVAKAVTKRLKRLTNKVEEGREDITEQDLEVLRGWRWRILLWSS